MMDVNQIRKDFPLLATQVHGKDLIYFDNAASTPKCLPVIERLDHHYRFETANIHRGVHFLSEQGTAFYEETRREIQSFINARFDHEILFTKGTTESINLVAQSFGSQFLKPSDQILLSTMEHHSNIVPWQMIAEKTGAQIIEIPIDDQGDIILSEYEKLLNPKVKMVSVVHISNALGTINPIKKMIQLAHSVGAKFLVDGAQSIAHTAIDVQDLDCDFFAFSAHKIFGPTGIGILFGKEELLNQMPPYQGGGDMIDQVSFEKTTYNTLPHKFEAGTPAIAEGIAFIECFRYVKRLGLAAIEEREAELLSYATRKMKELKDLRIIGEAQKKSAVISFTLDGAHPHDLGLLLDRQGIAIRTGHHCTQPLMKRLGVTATARASFCFYNTTTEIDQFILALKKAQELL